MGTRYVSRSGRVGRILVARLKPDCDLAKSLNEIFEKEGIRAGVIISGVGLLARARLRNCRSFPKAYPITDSDRSFLTFQRPFEILALSGNVGEVEGKPSVHAHVTLSFVENEQISVIGGHLVEGCVVFGFAEVVIVELADVDMTKEFDDETETLQLFAEDAISHRRKEPSVAQPAFRLSI